MVPQRVKEAYEMTLDPILDGTGNRIQTCPTAPTCLLAVVAPKAISDLYNLHNDHSTLSLNLLIA